MRRTVLAGLAAALLLPMPTVATAADVMPGRAGTWFEGIEAGTCFDDPLERDGKPDRSAPASIVPCHETHDSEVVARLPIGTEAFSEASVAETMELDCAEEYRAFLGRAIDSTLMYGVQIAPDADDWAAGAREVICVVTAGVPVVGTAASSDLRVLGELIAVYREVEGKPDIWLIDAGTGEAIRNVTDNDLLKVVGSPAWMPDGGSLAYSIQVGDGGGQSDVYMVPASGGESSPFVTGPAREDGAAFSPDGSQVAYASDDGAAEYEIYSADFSSGQKTRLTDHSDRDSSPQWSPDGSKIAFRRRTDGSSDIWVMNADGSDPLQLTESGGNYDPRWSPDGTQITFTTDRAGNFDIGVMDADGSSEQLLTTHPADDEYPSWSRDGRVLAFHSSRHGGISLWLMLPDGSRQSELTGLAPVGFPMFAPVPSD